MNNVMKREQPAAKQPATFGNVVDQIFQNNLSRFFDDSFWGSNGGNTRHSVPVNVRETTGSFEIELVAPGLRKEDFTLNVAADTLTVSFTHKEETSNDNGWLRREYRRQSFTRSFTLDDSVDAGNVSARYEDGVLHISLPKKESAQKISRTIEIQ